jgi:hypothetical protein
MACQTFGARKVHFGYLDCIYRKVPATGEAVITSDEDLFSLNKPDELGLVDLVAENLLSRLEEPSIWVCPLSLGGHVDHRIVRLAAEKVRKLLLYYADLPYAFSIPAHIVPGMIQFSLDIPEENLEFWKQGVLQYASQISSFWKDESEVAAQYSDYVRQYKGLPFWLPKPT